MSFCAELVAYSDWVNIAAAGLAAFAGGWAAFHAAQAKEDRKQKLTEQSKLAQCFYDLHFALRNVSHFHNEITKIHKNEPCNNTTESARQILNFQFDTQSVDFICSKCPLLYEIMSQIDMDWSVLNSVAASKNYDAISEHVMVICMKLMATIENIDDYLVKYYKQKSMIVGNVQKNLDAVLDVLPNLKQWKLTGDKKLEADPAVVAYKEWRVEV